MRVTHEPALRSFWYCIMPMSDLENGPRPFELLGEKIAVWKDADGAPHAIRDRCAHRSAALSTGCVRQGEIVCPYHGWSYGADGSCTNMPQREGAPPKAFKIAAYRCEERYGYVWVALDEPIHDIPHIPEAYDPTYRQINEFNEDWLCAPLRLMENAFDNSHLAFVHSATIGSGDPVPAENEIEDTRDGFITYVTATVGNPEHMRSAIGIEQDTTTRFTANQYFLPFFRVGRITYPNGLVNIHCTAATPMSEARTRRLQFVLRNDAEADVPTETIVAFDRQVSDEDQWILETTDENVPLDPSEGVEFSMPSDRPGLLMRRKLFDCLQVIKAKTAQAK